MVMLYFLHKQVLPLAIWGGILVLTGTMSIWIWPETNAIKLPETLEEAEELAKSKNKWLTSSCWKDS